jgi:hypothetical protein
VALPHFCFFQNLEKNYIRLGENFGSNCSKALAQSGIGQQS